MNQKSFRTMKQKERLEQMKLTLSMFLDLAKVMTALGILIVFSYCFYEAFAPSGVKLTDAFPFLYVAFSFSIIFLLGTILGAYASISIWRLILWIGNRFKPQINVTYHPIVEGKTQFALSSVVLALLVTLPFLTPLYKDPRYWRIVIFFILVGSFVLIMYLLKSNRAQPLSKSAKIYVILAVTVCGFVMYQPMLMNLTMSKVGMRSEPSDYILIDKSNFEFSSALAHSMSLPFRACKIGETNKWATRDLLVVWHGIGDKTFVRFVDSNGEKSLSMEGAMYPLPRIGVDILRDSHVTSLCK